MVRAGQLLLIDVAFAQVRPSPWRQAVDLGNMMLVLAVRTDPARVYRQALIKAGGGTALLVMELVDGSCAGIAHRSLRAANVMIGGDGRPRLTDFSFSELAATQRQMDLDLAELLASLAILTGADRPVSSAAVVIGAQGLAPAVPLLQPLALSAATRHAIARDDGLLAATRSAAAAAGAFYFILPQLAQVSSSWHAPQSVHWVWLPVIIAFSAVTYLASAAALVPGSAESAPLVREIERSTVNCASIP